MRTENKLSIRTAYARLWGVFGYGNCYALPFFEWYCNYKCYRACKEEELLVGFGERVQHRCPRAGGALVSRGAVPAGARAASSRRLRH